MATFTRPSLLQARKTNKQNQQRTGEVGKMYHSQAKIYLKLMPDKKRKISLGGFYSWEAYGRTFGGENMTTIYYLKILN